MESTTPPFTTRGSNPQHRSNSRVRSSPKSSANGRFRFYQVTPVSTRHELAQRVESALSQLSDQDGEIIIMRHYEQLSNMEVAEALQLTEPAASMRYLRAIRRLKQLLQQPSSDSSQSSGLGDQ